MLHLAGRHLYLKEGDVRGLKVGLGLVAVLVGVAVLAVHLAVGPLREGLVVEGPLALEALEALAMVVAVLAWAKTCKFSLGQRKSKKKATNSCGPPPPKEIGVLIEEYLLLAVTSFLVMLNCLKNVFIFSLTICALFSNWFLLTQNSSVVCLPGRKLPVVEQCNIFPTCHFLRFKHLAPAPRTGLLVVRVPVPHDDSCVGDHLDVVQQRQAGLFVLKGRLPRKSIAEK